jgi:DNA-binding protein HU-beta
LGENLVNKTDLIKAVAYETKMKEDTVKEVVDTFLDTIILSVSCDEPVLISRFGKFEPRKKKAVSRRNPRTGEEVEVPEKKAIGFVPSNLFKKKINSL